jgi:hypothetical protein
MSTIVEEGECERIQPASFLSVEEGARAHDAWVASLSERAACFRALGEHGTACTSSLHAHQRPSLGASAWGPGQLQRGAGDEAEQPLPAECPAAAGGGRASHAAGQDESAAPVHRSPAASTERGSKADWAQYVGVYYDEGRSATNPFRAQIRFGFKSYLYQICSCSAAEAAARAHDAIKRA